MKRKPTVTTKDRFIYPSRSSNDSEERRLAQWLISQRRHYKAGRLTDEQIGKLESLPNWSWDNKETPSKNSKSPLKHGRLFKGKYLPYEDE